MKQLKELCRDLIETKILAQQDCVISSLCLDSRQVLPHSLYFALAPNLEERHAHIQQALNKGAAFILSESQDSGFNTHFQSETPVINCPDLKNKVGHIAARFYDNPSLKLKMLGVTGTNGKSSITHYLAQSLNQLDLPCAVLGTVGNGFLTELTKSTHTTLDAINLQKQLALFVKQGAKAAALEVSSHGLDQGRVQGSIFDVAVFTNLTRDHLDYHGSMQAYGFAKRRLFLMQGLKAAVINYDDEFGKSLLEEFHAKIPCYAYTLKPTFTAPWQWVSADQLQMQEEGMTLNLQNGPNKALIKTALLGEFNLYNLLAVVASLLALGFSWQALLPSLSEIKPVKGRMQRLSETGKPHVVIDYAHTPDALEKALQALRAHYKGDIWCVFGCGGDRDQGKRPLMAKIAEQYSQHIIVTSDNPRSENPESIIAQIIEGLKTPAKAKIYVDRQMAILQSIRQAQAKDVILIAGKGHEDYQQIGSDFLPFDDFIEAKTALNNWKQPS